MAQGPENQTTEKSFFPPGLCLLRLSLLALQWPLQWAGRAPREWGGGHTEAKWGTCAPDRPGPGLARKAAPKSPARRPERAAPHTPAMRPLKVMRGQGVCGGGLEDRVGSEEMDVGVSAEGGVGGGAVIEVEGEGYIGLAMEWGQRMGVGATEGPDLSPGSE